VQAEVAVGAKANVFPALLCPHLNGDGVAAALVGDKPHAPVAYHLRLNFPHWSPPLFTELLKGDRGARAGKYLVIFEIESTEACDRYFPIAGERSEEAGQFTREHPETAAVFEQWAGLASLPGEVYTDYRVVAG
jgi:hypothetical protein